MDSTAAVATISGAVITVLGSIVAVLLKRILNSQEKLEPISNGFAGRVTKLLTKIRKTQAITLQRLDHLEEGYRELREADETLLEMISEWEKQP
jgi:hypothetical protein